MSSGVEFDVDNADYGVPRSGAPAHPVSSPGGISSSMGYAHPGVRAAGPGSRGIGGWLLRHGLAKSEGGAQAVMAAIVVINLIITFVIIKFLL